MSESNTLTIRLSQSERAKLVKLAEEKGSTLSAVAREAITATLRQGDLDARLVVAVQAETRRTQDELLDRYEDSMSKVQNALHEVLSGIIATTKQAIAPRTKEDAEADALRMMSPQDRANYERLKARNANASPHHVPSGEEESGVYAYTSAPRRK